MHCSIVSKQFPAVSLSVSTTHPPRRAAPSARTNASPADLLIGRLRPAPAQYTLLPHLLARGALCHVHFVFVEWHLNALGHDRKLEGFALRHAFESLLRQGCPGLNGGAQILVRHDEDRLNNFGEGVPGLRKLAKLHAPASSKGLGKG